MSTPLDPIWVAYEHMSDALKVVRRVVSSPELHGHPLAPLSATEFEGLAGTVAEARLDSAQEQLDDQTVLTLYAAFESALRDHLAAQSVHLRTNVTSPDSVFAIALAEQYESWCGEGKMDGIASLFLNAVGATLVAQAGQIRKYRHWLAHGKRGASPPQTTPAFAFKTLDAFLARV